MEGLILVCMHNDVTGIRESLRGWGDRGSIGVRSGRAASSAAVFGRSNLLAEAWDAQFHYVLHTQVTRLISGGGFAQPSFSP